MCTPCYPKQRGESLSFLDFMRFSSNPLHLSYLGHLDIWNIDEWFSIICSADSFYPIGNINAWGHTIQGDNLTCIHMDLPCSISFSLNELYLTRKKTEIRCLNTTLRLLKILKLIFRNVTNVKMRSLVQLLL